MVVKDCKRTVLIQSPGPNARPLCPLSPLMSLVPYVPYLVELVYFRCRGGAKPPAETPPAQGPKGCLGGTCLALIRALYNGKINDFPENILPRYLIKTIQKQYFGYPTLSKLKSSWQNTPGCDLSLRGPILDNFNQNSTIFLWFSFYMGPFSPFQRMPCFERVPCLERDPSSNKAPLALS